MCVCVCVCVCVEKYIFIHNLFYNILKILIIIMSVRL